MTEVNSGCSGSNSATELPTTTVAACTPTATGATSDNRSDVSYSRHRYFTSNKFWELSQVSLPAGGTFTTVTNGL